MPIFKFKPKTTATPTSTTPPKPVTRRERDQVRKQMGAPLSGGGKGKPFLRADMLTAQQKAWITKLNGLRAKQTQTEEEIQSLLVALRDDFNKGIPENSHLAVASYEDPTTGEHFSIVKRALPEEKNEDGERIPWPEDNVPYQMVLRPRPDGGKDERSAKKASRERQSKSRQRRAKKHEAA